MSFYDRIRHRAAATVTEAEPRGGGFDSLAGRKHALLVSYRRGGEAIPTPIWFGLDGETAYMRTEADAAKVKRIRRNPDVLVAPCTLRGKPLGPPVAGRARVVAAGEEEQRAEQAIEANYGVDRKLFNRVVTERGPATVYLAVEPRAP